MAEKDKNSVQIEKYKLDSQGSVYAYLPGKRAAYEKSRKLLILLNEMRRIGETEEEQKHVLG